MPSEAPPGTSADPGITGDELRLATRNHGMPLEALRYETTPVGLHYLLIHYDIPQVDIESFRLEVDGLVDRPLSLSVDDLRARPAVTSLVTFECAGNGRALLEPRPVSQPWLVEAVGTGEWTGTPLRRLLEEEAGIAPGALEVVFTGLDRGTEGGVEQVYQRSLPLTDALADDVLVAYALNGEPLPPQHGFPVRLVVPGWYGMTNVKWLARISVVDRPFDGYQQTRGYRFRQNADEEGAPVTRMLPRALMIPPGIPDFATRRRIVRRGACALSGRAWSGQAPVEAVEVSTDGGTTWESAELGEQAGPHAWRSWRYDWVADSAGDRELCCRAHDSLGASQPLAQPWNLGGYANNAVQRVPVTVV